MTDEHGIASPARKTAGRVRISVAVCTRDRSASLRRLFTSMTQLAIPTAIDWELLLIDNGSTDDTRAVAESFRADLPLRYVEHSVAGIANARQRALDEASGDYICWTDDDTTVCRGWLAAYVEAFTANPSAALFGGPILPELMPGTPRWIRRAQHRWPLASIVGSRDPTDVPARIGPLPWGANWAVRVHEFRAFGFDTKLGRGLARRLLAEETDAMSRMRDSGVEGWWVPLAKVTHFPTRDRLTWRGIYGHHFSQGATDAYMMSRSGRGGWASWRRDVAVMSRRTIRDRAVRHGLAYLLSMVACRPRQAVCSLARCAYLQGFAYGRHHRGDHAAG